MPNERLFSAFAKWKTPTRTQLDLARSAGVPQSSLSRAFAGDLRPEPDTFAKILSAVATEDAELARELLEAYLLDDVPEGLAPDGQPWAAHVRLTVSKFGTSAVVQETPDANDEVERAIEYLTNAARTTRHGQQFVLSFYRLSHRPPTNYYGLPKPGA